MVVREGDYSVTSKHLLDALHLILILLHSLHIVDAANGGVITEIKAKLVSVAPKAIHQKLFDQPFVFSVHGD